MGLKGRGQHSTGLEWPCMLCLAAGGNVGKIGWECPDNVLYVEHLNCKGWEENVIHAIQPKGMDWAL